jgi:XRE family transcriptional regulator, regulator of sulfur utilization
MKRLGERIKRKREFQNIQMNDLAKRVGISASALSQIEKAKASPSIVTLKSIADNLNTTVGELIGENENLSQHPLISNGRAEFVDENTSGSQIFLLSNHGQHKLMETYLIKFVPHSDIQNIINSNKGQAFCYVLSGNYNFNLDDSNYVLNPGDSFYFDLLLPYSVNLISESNGEMIWIIAQ